MCCLQATSEIFEILRNLSGDKENFEIYEMSSGHYAISYLFFKEDNEHCDF